MYAGHVGIALALRGRDPAPPLWLVVLAAQGPDWADALWVMTGRPLQLTRWPPHGFPMLLFGAAACACVAVAFAVRRGTPRAKPALLVATAYVSHWFADYFTGIKPTWPGGPFLGLQWYQFPARDLALESAVIVAGWLVWRRTLPAETRWRGRTHPLAWALLAVLLALQTAGDVVMARH